MFHAHEMRGDVLCRKKAPPRERTPVLAVAIPGGPKPPRLMRLDVTTAKLQPTQPAVPTPGARRDVHTPSRAHSRQKRLPPTSASAFCRKRGSFPPAGDTSRRIPSNHAACSAARADPSGRKARVLAHCVWQRALTPPRSSALMAAFAFHDRIGMLAPSGVRFSRFA